MPSEVIYGSGGDVDVRVSWGNDESGTVQVVSQAADRPGLDGPTARLLNIVNDWLTSAGMLPVDVAELTRRAPAPPHFDGWWATLDDWGACNRLIRVLQRARDRAFGPPA